MKKGNSKLESPTLSGISSELYDHRTEENQIMKIQPRRHFGIVAAVALASLTVFTSSWVVPCAFAQDKLGTATITKLSGCPSGGAASGSCYSVTISNCPETNGNFVASIKVNVPPNMGKPIGAIFMTVGGSGIGYYDNFSSFMTSTPSSCPLQGSKYNCGRYVVEQLNNANYETIQTNFSDPSGTISEPVGWLTGPATDGPRALACRYATLANAVWTGTILNKTTLKPVCATGNSAGSSAVAYALTQYGLSIAPSSGGPGPLISMVEATSGPPMGRIDHGCSHAPPSLAVDCPSGTSLKEGYGTGTSLQFIDPAYDGDQETTADSADICAESILGNQLHTTLFQHDSVVSDDYSSPSYPKTFVNFVFGSADGSSAVPLGTEWFNAITSSKPAAPACVSGAPHELPGYFAGASQIVTDLTSMCKLQ